MGKIKIYELAKELKMKNKDDVMGFNLALGGCIEGQYINFGSNAELVKKIEDWQILSAYKRDPEIGTATINRLIQGHYHSAKSKVIDGYIMRRTPYPLGADNILYGDKVINIINTKVYGYNFIKKYTEKGYVANGEVGIVDNFYEDKKDHKNYHRIRFSSQPEMGYGWQSIDNEELSEF